MLGAVLLALAIVVVIPVGVMVTGAVVAVVLGWSLKEDADARYAGSELLALDR